MKLNFQTLLSHPGSGGDCSARLRRSAHTSGPRALAHRARSRGTATAALAVDIAGCRPRTTAGCCPGPRRPCIALRAAERRAAALSFDISECCPETTASRKPQLRPPSCWLRGGGSVPTLLPFQHFQAAADQIQSDPKLPENKLGTGSGARRCYKECQPTVGDLHTLTALECCLQPSR